MATDLAFNFQDEWNPVTGVPDLGSLTLNNTTDKSKYWVVTAAKENETITGTLLNYAVGDGVAWNGEKWVKIPASDLALSKVMALEDVILSTEAIGSNPVSVTNSLASATTCYLDSSVFTKAGTLKQINIITPTAGVFTLVHFRKTGNNQWSELNNYPAKSTVSSTSVYNQISVDSLNVGVISIQPGDCLGFFKAAATTESPSATIGRNESVSGKFTQTASIGADNKFSFTNANFPNTSGSSSIIGRELGLNFVSEINAVIQNSTDIAALKSKTFIVPADFNWNYAGNVSPLANTECIISNQFDISSVVTLPQSIRLRLLPGAKFNTAITNKMSTLNLSDGVWAATGDAHINNDGKSFSTSTTYPNPNHADGKVSKTGILQNGSSFTLHITGVTTASSVQVSNGSGTIMFTPPMAGTFDISITQIYTGSDTSIAIRTLGTGITIIDTFNIYQGGYLKSPVDYGETDVQHRPVIDNVSGFNFINGGILSGMFKAANDVVLMSDYFADNAYPAKFYDSFVKTKFVVNKDLAQIGYDYSSINVGITDARYQNYKGLSEGCGIEGVEGVTLSELYLYATGDFYIKNITVNNGRVNICNFYKRPLKLTVSGCTFTNVTIDNKQAHDVAKSVIVQADISDSTCTITLSEADFPPRNVFWFLSVINSRISNCHFAHPNYRPSTLNPKFGGDIGQPIVLQSSINSVYESNTMDNGDSGLLFYFEGPDTADYSNWIEKYHMDFNGFENNIIRGNTMYNMTEEGFSCDSTDSSYPTLTMNRNRFEIDSVNDDKRTAIVKLKIAEKDKKYESLINTMMTSITDKKFGKYCKILKVEEVEGDTTGCLFKVTGSADFFKDAVKYDQYAVTYAFFNNIIENNSFVNCCVPVLLYLYAFHNIVRGNSVFGGNNLKGVGNMRVLSYSARRERCYIAPSIDNLFENNVMVNNGFHILCSKNPTEWPNDWLTGNPEPFDGTITRDADLNTVIRGNVFKDTAIKLQGLTGCIFENNQLINTPTEITDTSFYSEMGNLINESDNIGIDNLFARAEAAGNTLIPLISRGDGCGYIRLKIVATGDIAVSVNGSAFLYDSETSTTASRFKTYTPTGGEVLVYAKCLSGEAQLIISNAFKITGFGNNTDDFLLKYDPVNSPDVYMLKSRFLPKNITGIKQTSANCSINLRGNVSNLPTGLLNLNIDDSKGSLMDGFIQDFPRSLTSIYLNNPLLWSYTVAFRGNLADLPNGCITFYDDTASGVYTYTHKTGTERWLSGTMKTIHIYLSPKHFWTPEMVDGFLADLAAASWVTSGGSLYLNGSGLTRTSNSNGAIDTLRDTYHVSILKVPSVPPPPSA